MKEFKAFDKIDEKIRPITLIDFDNKLVELVNEYTKEIYVRRMKEVELLPCIGIKDKNGKKIHKGDIIAIYPTNKEYYGEKAIFVVEISIGNWGYDIFWKPIKGYQCSTHIMNSDEKCNWEVIGNIYKNKELLEGLNDK